MIKNANEVKTGDEEVGCVHCKFGGESSRWIKENWVFLTLLNFQAERRYQSRLQDAKDRLEQSDSTNRSLQNYVQFLKASYASVFGDSTLSGTSLRAHSGIWHPVHVTLRLRWCRKNAQTHTSMLFFWVFLTQMSIMSLPSSVLFKCG